MKNGLYIVATPIGNLADISSRAREILQKADVIACEDTRVTRKLFSLIGIGADKEFITYQNYNEEQQSPLLLQKLNEGKCIALVSDAGSPLISDPGYKIVRKCRENGIYVSAIPGCCAVITALQLSGLPTNRFMFAGFIPNKEKARIDLFNELKNIDTTLVFYETANRLLKTLEAMKTCFGNREIAVARELTKMYEECRSGTAAELIGSFTEKEPKGEMVVMVAPPQEKTGDDFDLTAALSERLDKMPLKTAVKEVVELSRQNKNDIYALALKIKDEK